MFIHMGNVWDTVDNIFKNSFPTTTKWNEHKLTHWRINNLNMYPYQRLGFQKIWRIGKFNLLKIKNLSWHRFTYSGKTELAFWIRDHVLKLWFLHGKQHQMKLAFKRSGFQERTQRPDNLTIPRRQQAISVCCSTRGVISDL